jgi:hypothetical protein
MLTFLLGSIDLIILIATLIGSISMKTVKIFVDFIKMLKSIFKLLHHRFQTWTRIEDYCYIEIL